MCRSWRASPGWKGDADAGAPLALPALAFAGNGLSSEPTPRTSALPSRRSSRLAALLFTLMPICSAKLLQRARVVGRPQRPERDRRDFHDTDDGVLVALGFVGFRARTPPSW
jgi:hypothetical protein